MEPPEYCPKPGEAFCTRCEDWRDYDVLPGHPETRGNNGRVFGAIPAFAFCVKCGWQIDLDIEETA
jgi:hypothetical protein